MAETPAVTKRLDSWKEIASYLGRSVRTVIRWEEQNGLPVHRIPGGERRSVYAYPREIDLWMRTSGELDKDKVVESTSNSAPSSTVPQASFRTAISNAATSLLAHGSQVSMKRVAWFGTAGLLICSAIYGLIRLSEPHHYRYVSETQITRDLAPKVGLVADSKNLYFGEWHGGRLVLSTVSINGGPIRDIATPFVRAEPVSLRGDGTRLLVLASEGHEVERPLWTVPVSGRPPQRVGGIMCHSAAWSPDGNEIAYASGNSIYLTADDGEHTHHVHTFASVPLDLRWSLDGKRILFRLQDMATSASVIWTLSLGSTDHFALASLAPLDPLPRNYATISPVLNKSDGVFAALRVLNPPILELERTRFPWRSTFKLAQMGIASDAIGSFAADPGGKRLYFLREFSKLEELEWFDRRTRAFHPFLPGISACDVDFSRDGRWIAYVRTPENTLWVARPNGSEARQINASGVIELPRWSPDGKRIAFMSRLANAPWRIFVVSLADGTPREASDGTDNQGAPTWSPDSRFLIYGRVECQEDRTCTIQKIDLGTGKQTMVPGSEGLSTARWSPDGRYVAALCSESHQVFLSRWQSGTWHKIADGINGNNLAWSSDSQTLYASNPNGNVPEVLRISLRGGTVAPIADLSDISKCAGHIDTWFAVTPDNSILFMHMVDVENIYSLQYSEE